MARRLLFPGVMMFSAESLQAEARRGAAPIDSASQVLEEARLLAASSAAALPPITLALAVLYSVLAPLRWLFMAPPQGLSLALVAMVSSACLTISTIDQRRHEIEGERAHRMLALCGLLVVADFLAHAWLAPSHLNVAVLCLIVVACGFLLLSTPWLARLLAVAIGGFYFVRLTTPADFETMSWPLAVVPAVAVSLIGHSLRLRAVQAQASLLLQARAAETHATEAARRLTVALQSQQRLRDVLEASPDVIRIVSKDASLLYENAASRAIDERSGASIVATRGAAAAGVAASLDDSGAPSLGDSGARPAASEAAPSLARYPRWAAARVREEALPQADRFGVWSGETAILAGDGREIPMSQVVIAHKNLRGEVEAYSTVMRDMSAAKQAERELRRELHLSDTLARIGRELLEMRGTTPLLDRACRLTRDVLGCDSTQTFLLREGEEAYVAIGGIGDPVDFWPALVAMRLPRVWMPGLLAQLRREKWIAVDLDDRGEGRSLDSWIDRDGGEARAWFRQFRDSGVRTLGVLALWRGDRMIGFQTACYRSRRRPSSEQVRAAKGFAHLVSLALENAQLVRELEHANALKSDFVSAVSHELRSPLNVILGYNELMLDGTFGDLSDEQRDTLQRMDQQAHQLLEHINETLDFGRLEAGRTAVRSEDVGVDELFWELEAEARPWIDQRAGDVAVRFAPAEDLPQLHTDREKTKVVLKNLLGNALKFTESGRVEISAEARNRGVEFRVRDTGVGIPAAELAAIFEPFRQVKGTKTNGCKGVGLGLNIAQRFAGMLGGNIEVESEVGVGSTFRFWLPAGEGAGARLSA